MTALREQRRRGTGHPDTKGSSHYLLLTQIHVRVEKSTSWRTSAALTPLNIEQRDRRGGGHNGTPRWQRKQSSRASGTSQIFQRAKREGQTVKGSLRGHKLYRFISCEPRLVRSTFNDFHCYSVTNHFSFSALHWSVGFICGQQVWEVTFLCRSDQATPQLWRYNITHVRAWSSATHNPTLSKAADKVPPTPTDMPSAVAASAHNADTHANTFNFQRDVVKMHKVTASRTDCLDPRAASWDGQMSWKWQRR